ncbi:zinc finger protein 567-like [Belonocnema kinseyi]|uniref:zinc finger protein 567-like n=1 Tax=Belonocnema kinseyi TaxID=2817044 RepID=UPI00143D395A|nr:zinc finger protein 567-like [Belonocnema kinseyi]
MLSYPEYSSHVTKKPERNPKYGKKSCTTEISFYNSSKAINSILYDDDKTLEIKEKTVEIEYDYDETLDIKEENIQDRETEKVTSRRFNTKYESKVCSVDLGEDILAVNIEQQSHKQQEMKNLKPEIQYKCKKCARSYKKKSYLTFHRKYECDVLPQFACHFCGRRFKQKNNMIRHVGLVHLKSNTKISKTKYNCNICERSYKYLRSLNQHKLIKHAGIIRQFVCDYCGHKANQKYYLAIHIHSHHLK